VSLLRERVLRFGLIGAAVPLSPIVLAQDQTPLGIFSVLESGQMLVTAWAAVAFSPTMREARHITTVIHHTFLVTDFRQWVRSTYVACVLLPRRPSVGWSALLRKERPCCPTPRPPDPVPEHTDPVVSRHSLRGRF
jgi:hypothetical protein